MASPAPPAADELPGPAARRLYSSQSSVMQATTMEGQPLALSLAEKAVCKVVYGAPRPRPLLLPVGLELWLYVQKMRNLQRKRTIGDRMGEAKASGNLGNTLKVLGRFDEAIVCCQRHLDIAQEQGDKASCLELALEGERLCKAGDFKAGVAFFEAAVQVGTEDLKTLSAIYSQLGNAYFYLKEYSRALQFHKHDLLLARRNLSLVKELGDRAAQGRAYGNLGNTHYLLGNFTEATTFHKERLAIAKEFGDKAAERRAYSNLGNAHIFLGRFDVAAEHYKKTLQLSRQLRDQAVEAQACYSLGNTYTLLQDYERAAEYHLRHLVIAQELADRVGEGRACWSLGNAYVSMGSPAQALTFAKKHLQISQEIGDRNGELTARMNIAQLQLALGRLTSPAAAEKPDLAGYEAQDPSQLGPLEVSSPQGYLWLTAGPWTLEKSLCSKEDIRERNPVPWSPGMQLLKAGRHCESLGGPEGDPHSASKAAASECPSWWGYYPTLPAFPLLSPSGCVADGYFAHGIQNTVEQNGDTHHTGDWRGPGRDSLPLPMRSRKYQEGVDTTERRPREGSHSPLDSADVRVQVPRTGIPRAPSSDEECFFDLLSKFQSSRMDDQRCPLEEGQAGAAEATAAPALEERAAQPSVTASPQTEEFFDLIASSQSRRLDDQRASVGSLPGLRITLNNVGHLRGDGDPQEPGDEFFNMLIKYQSSRIDDQRCPPPDVLPRGPTMPDEDFFSLIQRVQAKRMDEQRVDLAGSPEQEASGLHEPRQQCPPGAS
ncbi:hypothetical protein NN561_002662 [Cricetulus griseus]